MKKTYVKPEVCFESFQLSANIATGCGMPLNHGESDCSEVPGIGTLFAKDDCLFTVGDDGSSNFCYHAPEETNRIFTS